jgi:hypothetical protein
MINSEHLTFNIEEQILEYCSSLQK